MNILNEIKSQKDRTGLRIIDNIFDFGRCDVVDETGKSHYRGSHISCQLFINEFDRFLLNAKAGTNGQEDTKNDGNAV